MLAEIKQNGLRVLYASLVAGAVVGMADSYRTDRWAQEHVRMAYERGERVMDYAMNEREKGYLNRHYQDVVGAIEMRSSLDVTPIHWKLLKDLSFLVVNNHLDTQRIAQGFERAVLKEAEHYNFAPDAWMGYAIGFAVNDESMMGRWSQQLSATEIADVRDYSSMFIKQQSL